MPYNETRMSIAGKGAMDVQNVLRMIGGEGSTSYAANSQLQENVIMKEKSVVTEAIVDLYKKSFPKLLRVADFGCSSGPNSLLVVSEIIDALHETCQKEGYASTGFQFFLNDLPGNDFNSLFMHVPRFLEKIRLEKGDEFGACFIAGVPGSFYRRLFPEGTLDFVHSSYSLHFLSQVPPGVENNRGNIYIAPTSPTNVAKAYWTQFRKDFTVFLNTRSKEILPGGRMVITMLGRKTSNPCSTECCYLWDIMVQSLRDLVSQEIIKEAKLNSFNVPCYYPSMEEIRTLVQEEGSFQLDCLEMVDVGLDVNEGRHSGLVASVRAVTEPMIASQFGEEIIEHLFCKYTEHASKNLESREFKFATLVMCMTKCIAKFVDT